MPTHYITGCNLRLPLTSEQPFRLADGVLARCKTRGLSKADTHSAAKASCAHCDLNRSPCYLEAGPPWEYEKPEPPADPPPFLPEESQGDTFDPAEWGAVDDSIDSGGTALPRKPKAAPTGKPPTVAEAAVDLPKYPREERRPKEAVISQADVLAATPPPTPAARPPVYSPPTTRPSEKTTVTGLLEEADVAGGPSVLGWSKIKMGRLCLRSFYYRWIAGLVPKTHGDMTLDDNDDVPETQRSTPATRLSPLDIGSVFHATLELHRRTGGMRTWDALYALRAAHPTLVLEVKRLVDAYIAKWGPIENREWDLRGTERESRYYFPSRRCAGRNRRLCISSRHDFLYHPLRQGEARAPVSQPASSIYVGEMKTARAISREGYRVDAQILLHAATFKWGMPVTPNGVLLVDKTSEEIYGPLRGVTLDWIVKATKLDPSKHLQRQTYMVSEPQLKHFLESLGEWLYEELGARVFHAERETPSTWPQSWTCHGMFYPTWICPYHYLCDMASAHRGWQWQYEVADTLDLAALELPYKVAKTRRKKGRAVAEIEGK